MPKPATLATSVTLVWATAYALCGIVAMTMPDLYFGVLKTWMHSLNIDVVKSTTAFSPMVFVTGILTFSLYIWVITFAVAVVYNMLAKKKR